jgi:transcriptional regulator with XRE-family HTH domain
MGQSVKCKTMDADHIAAIALAENLSRLMAERGMTQADLAKRSGVAQRTISTLLDASRPDEINPRFSTLVAIAGHFGIPHWQLLIPDLPVDLLLSPAIGRVVSAYRDASTEGRANISRVAEAEVRFAKIRNA